MKRRRRRILPKGDINVTPFIDILLVLLVIFMTITPKVTRGLKTAIPQATPPGEKQPVDENIVILSMDRSGNIKINQDDIAPSRLMDRLREIFKKRSDRTVFVQANNDLLFSDVAQLIDSAKGAGIDRVGLMTDQISGK